MTGKGVVIALVGNKKDLESERTVKTEEGKRLAEEYNMTFMEISAYTGESLAAVFDETGKRVLEEVPPIGETAKEDGCKFDIDLSNSIRTSFEFYRMRGTKREWSSTNRLQKKRMLCLKSSHTLFESIHNLIPLT